MLLERGVKSIILTRGAKGIIVATKKGKQKLAALPAKIINVFDSLSISNFLQVTGAGDSLTSGIALKLSQKINNTNRIPEIELSDMEFGLKCAKAALETESAVNPNIYQLVTKNDGIATAKL